MKILLLADRMESGGAETHIQTLARGLSGAGHEVGLCSFGGSLADELAREGVNCRILPKIGRNPFAFLAARRILRKEVRKNGYEILHAHTRMTALLANRICNPYMRKSAKTPVLVVTAHAKFRAGWLDRHLSVWGDATIAVSEDLRAFLADKYRLPVEQITVIPNGIDETRFCPARQESEPLGEMGVLAGFSGAGEEKPDTSEKFDVEEKTGAGENPGVTGTPAGNGSFTKAGDPSTQPGFDKTAGLGETNVLAGSGKRPVKILFVSRLDADCSLGADLLCAAALRLSTAKPALPDFSITLAGRGSEFSRLCALAGRVNSLLGREVLRVVKPQSEGDLIALYRAADLFVGVSRAAMEASFCGAPVLLCGNEGYGGLFSPDRPTLAASNLTCRGEPLPTGDRLCRDLADLLKNPSRLRANAEKTSAWMRKTFSAASALRATEKVYKRLLWRRFVKATIPQSSKLDSSLYTREPLKARSLPDNKIYRPARSILNGKFLYLSSPYKGRRRARAPEGSAQTRPPRLVIGGYAGCGNLGDDAIAKGLLFGFWQKGIPLDSVTLLSGHPRRDSIRFGVRCVGRKNPVSVIPALLRASVFVSGGGTLLQNRTGKFSLFYYLTLLRLARLLGCKTVILGGIGEISGAFSRKLVKKELERCAGVLLREERSAQLARESGVRNTNLTVGADATFLLPDPPPFRAAYLVGRLIGDLQKPFLCVCPCGGVDISGISALLRRSFPGFFPLFLLCDQARDAVPARLLQRSFGGVVYAPRDVSEALALFGASALVISARLHPLILSVRAGARCVCFSGGDPKLPAFCRRADIPLFAASDTGNPPSAALLFARPLPKCNDFCRDAAKDLANLCKIVYNGREDPFPARARGKRRTFYEERATGGSAPPDHH